MKVEDSEVGRRINLFAGTNHYELNNNSTDQGVLTLGRWATPQKNADHPGVLLYLCGTRTKTTSHISH